MDGGDGGDRDGTGGHGGHRHDGVMAMVGGRWVLGVEAVTVIIRVSGCDCSDHTRPGGCGHRAGGGLVMVVGLCVPWLCWS